MFLIICAVIGIFLWPQCLAADIPLPVVVIGDMIDIIQPHGMLPFIRYWNNVLSML